jgi:hypothetical protein
MRIGDLVQFNYSQGKRIHDENPKVLVLHDNWQGLIHGLNFNYLSLQEINYIKAVLNPVFEADIVRKDARIAAQMDRIRPVLDTLNITSPYDFYLRFVRGFIQPRGWDPYRRYNPRAVMGEKLITRKELLVGDEKEGIFARTLGKLSTMRGPRMLGFGGNNPQGPSVDLPGKAPTKQYPFGGGGGLGGLKKKNKLSDL